MFSVVQPFFYPKPVFDASSSMKVYALSLHVFLIAFGL